MKKKEKYQFGGTLPGTTGLMYARTGPTPSNGKYAKKTKPSAQDGKKVAYTNPQLSDILVNELTKKVGTKVQYSPDPIGDIASKYGDKYAGYDYIDIDPKISIDRYPKNLREVAMTEGFSKEYPNRHIVRHYTKEPAPTATQPFVDKPYYASYKDVPKRKSGGIIEDNMGQYNHPGKVTKIKSNRITMKDIPYPVLGISDKGHKQMMYPEGEYAFDGSSVTEYPLTNQDKGQLKKLDQLTDFSNMNNAKSGIHIKPENRGKFTAYKKRTGKTTEEALHSKDPHVRQMANFARNAKKWHHGQNGTMLDALGYEVPVEGNLDSVNSVPNYSTRMQGVAESIGGQVNQSLKSIGQKVPDQNLSGLGGAKPQGGVLGSIGGIGGALTLGTDLLQGAQMLKQDKNQKKDMKKFAAMSDVTLQAASLRPEQVKRKYTRPEDMVIDPNELSKSYGTGTNFLAAKDGKKIKKAQFGMKAGSLTGAAASKLFGGTGEQSGAGKIGTTAGSAIGNLILPGIGGTIGGALGGFVGGAIGAKGQKETAKHEQQGFQNLQNAAFQQGTAALQNQYSSFMRSGGHLRENIMQMGGELKTHWGGEAEPISQNRHLPDGGESVLFRGKSHDDGGIGVTFGKSPIEVEGGEPAVKLQDGGTGEDNLVVFGNMKIPSYGVSEIGDERAKGKKFKNYVNDLNKMEVRQNNIVDKGANIVNENPVATPYDRLKFNSGKAMMLGGDMKLKAIAQKKQMASVIQNAILETAEEHGLESDALAKGKIKKANFGAKLSSYQEGGDVQPSMKGPGWENYLNAYLPYLRPSNKQKLDSSQLSGEMFALSTNQLEPVQAQRYNPLLEQATDISLQDQINANQSDFNSIQRQVGNNPAALSTLAAQKYAANSNVLGEQFRQNQNNKLGVYNRNRGVLNDATLKNMAILDQQYVRQSEAKSNTKAQAQAALSSISDKIAKNKLENKTLGIYENLYNFRFGPQGRAWNLNGPAQFNTEAYPMQQLDKDGNVVETNSTSTRTDRFGFPQGGTRTHTTKTSPKNDKKGSRNGSIIQAMKNC